MIRYPLHVRYMSRQTYRLLFEECPMLFLSLLNNIQQRGVDALKAFFRDCVLMIDQMY